MSSSLSSNCSELLAAAPKASCDPVLEHPLIVHGTAEEANPQDSEFYLMHVETRAHLPEGVDSTCPVSLEEFGAVLYKFDGEHTIDFVLDKPQYCIARFLCNHRFDVWVAVVHMLSNGMVCPMCRAGPRRPLSIRSVPSHARAKVMGYFQRNSMKMFGRAVPRFAYNNFLSQHSPASPFSGRLLVTERSSGLAGSADGPGAHFLSYTASQLRGLLAADPPPPFLNENLLSDGGSGGSGVGSNGEAAISVQHLPQLRSLLNAEDDMDDIQSEGYPAEAPFVMNSYTEPVSHERSVPRPRHLQLFTESDAAWPEQQQQHQQAFAEPPRLPDDFLLPATSAASGDNLQQQQQRRRRVFDLIVDFIVAQRVVSGLDASTDAAGAQHLGTYPRASLTTFLMTDTSESMMLVTELREPLTLPLEGRGEEGDEPQQQGASAEAGPRADHAAVATALSSARSGTTLIVYVLARETQQTSAEAALLSFGGGVAQQEEVRYQWYSREYLMVPTATSPVRSQSEVEEGIRLEQQGVYLFDFRQSQIQDFANHLATLDVLSLRFTAYTSTQRSRFVMLLNTGVVGLQSFVNALADDSSAVLGTDDREIVFDHQEDGLLKFTFSSSSDPRLGSSSIFQRLKFVQLRVPLAGAVEV